MRVSIGRCAVAVGLLGIATALCACSASRVGWGKGRFVVVHESSSLQVRRSTIRLEDPAGDVVMGWIGARTPGGEPLLAELTVIVFDDRDGNARVGPGEMRFQRTASATTTKILFSDLRVPYDDSRKNPSVLVEARTTGGALHTSTFPFAPDP